MKRRRRAVAGLLVAVMVVVVAVAALVGTGGSGSSSPPVVTIPEPPPPAGPLRKPSPPGEAFGASVNRLFNDRIYSPARVQARLRDLHADGATLARSDALWETTEPAPPANGVHHYDWTFDDLIASSLARNGLRWLPILDYTPRWDASVAGQEHSAPRSSKDFAAFATAFAQRYGAAGAFWRSHPSLPADPVETYEVWNEPDLKEFWMPAPDAGAYAELYLRTRDAIVAVDPAARVIVGGLTNPRAFLPALLRARPDLNGRVDGVAIHPYAADPLGVLAFVRGARLTLDALGLTEVPLYVTEVGWTTRPAGAHSYAPASARPGYISTTLAALGHTDCEIAATVLYTWVTPERDPANAQDWFGIQPPSGGSTADTEAFAAGVRHGEAPGPTLRFCRR